MKANEKVYDCFYCKGTGVQYTLTGDRACVNCAGTGKIREFNEVK